MTAQSEALSLNRSVTVNFMNANSCNLNRTSPDFERTAGLHNVEPLAVIQPGQSVQWVEKTSALAWFSWYADYSFDGGSLSVSWSNPIHGSNEYTVSCNPDGPYVISYQGGSGTEATIDVCFYEPCYNAAWVLLQTDSGASLVATGDNSVACCNSGISDEALWAVVDLTTGANVDFINNSDGNFKISNKKYMKWLTVYMYSGNTLGLYLGADGPDQYWFRTRDTENWGAGASTVTNVNCNLLLSARGSEVWVAQPDSSLLQAWSVVGIG
jgi:hypothetical protein